MAKIERKCIQCGEVFYSFPSVVKKGYGKFCSKSCGTRYRDIHSNPTKIKEVCAKISANHADVSGSNNPMYGRTGVLSTKYIDGRTNFKGEKYRRMLLANTKKEDLKCVLCGGTEKLEAHHKDGDHKNNDINNLIWLCSDCHRKKAHVTHRDKNGRFTNVTTNQII